MRNERVARKMVHRVEGKTSAAPEEPQEGQPQEGAPEEEEVAGEEREVGEDNQEGDNAG